MPKINPLADAYQRAGTGFLAHRIEGMFRVLKTPEDVALHNSIQREVMKIGTDDPSGLERFYKLIATKMLEDRTRLTFSEFVSEAILKVPKT